MRRAAWILTFLASGALAGCASSRHARRDQGESSSHPMKAAPERAPAGGRVRAAPERSSRPSEAPRLSRPGSSASASSDEDDGGSVLGAILSLLSSGSDDGDPESSSDSSPSRPPVDWGYGYRSFDQQVTEPARSMHLELQLGGLISEPSGLGGGGGLRLERERFGLDAGFDLFQPDRSSRFVYSAAHLSYALLTGEFYRVRLELGCSLVSLGEPVAGGGAVVYPEAGVSASLGLMGPIGLEGQARFSTAPFRPSDLAFLMVARWEILAFKLGLRQIESGPTLGGPPARYGGPFIGVSMLLF